MLEKKETYLLSILIGILAGSIGIVLLYALNFTAILKTLQIIEGANIILIVVVLRMSLLAMMAYIMFKQWFSQENQFFSDLPFLFGLFFLILIFGKLLDMLYYFTYFTLDEETVLVYIKIRQFVAISTLAPMLYLSIMMILFFLTINEKIHKYNDTRERDIISMKILFLILIIESIAIILTPNPQVAGIILPLFVIPSLIIVVWIFYFSYKNQRLSSVHPLIVSFGFAAFLCSNIFRPLAQFILGETAIFTIIVEIVDIIVFIVIFTGLIIKVKY